MGWLRGGWSCAVLVALASMSCSGENDGGSAGEGGGEGGSEGGGAETSGTDPSGTEDAGTSPTTQADTSADDGGNEGVEDCENANEGAACASPGEVCSNGDDCGSWTYECQNGTWVQIDGTGCGAEPIPCSASPVENDGCGEAWYEECDPDGDCRDVLECNNYEWVLHEVCCAEVAPEQGKACDEPWRYCITEGPRGEITFACEGGVWQMK